MSSIKSALTLTIPEPCSENFNEMIPIKGGRFCDSCEKTIVDFRAMSDGQILNHYQKNKGEICGVFNEVQLNRAMPFPMKPKPNRSWKAVAALTAGLMFSSGLVGQSTTSKTNNPVILEQSLVKGKQIDVPNQTTIKKLKGIILGIGVDFNEPLIGANIFIKGTTIGVTTGIEGDFELSIPTNLTSFEIVISYTGFETETLFFEHQSSIPSTQVEIVLARGLALEEVVVVGYGIAKKRALGGVVTIVTEAVADTLDSSVIEAKVSIVPEVKVFPNPFISNLNVSFDYNAAGDYLFHIYDMNGRLLFAKTYHLLKGKQTVELDLANQHLMNGAYILQISDKKDSILATKKVFKGQA